MIVDLNSFPNLTTVTVKFRNEAGAVTTTQSATYLYGDVYRVTVDIATLPLGYYDTELEVGGLVKSTAAVRVVDNVRAVTGDSIYQLKVYGLIDTILTLVTSIFNAVTAGFTAVLNAIAALGSGTNITIDASQVIFEQEEIDNQHLDLYNDTPTDFTLVLTEGVFDGLPMTFVIENQNTSTDVISVTGLTSTTNTMIITIPPTPPQEYGTCGVWSLRNTATGKLKTSGSVKFLYAPIKD